VPYVFYAPRDPLDVGREHPDGTSRQIHRALRASFGIVAAMRRTLVTALVLCAPAASASPQDLFGYGARAIAMGATGVSFVDDYSAAHANPAGASRARGRSITFGYAATGFDLTRNSEYFPADPGSATLIGLSVGLPFGGVLRDRVGLALGFFTPTNVIVRGRIVRPTTAQFTILPDRVQSVALQLGLGFDLGYGFRVGGGFTALAALQGNVLVTNDAAGRSTTRIDNQLVASYAPIVGASWQRGPWRVGATYRGELVARFTVLISAPELGIPIPTLNVAGVAQYDPAQLQVEAAWQHRGWTVALGVTAKQWSAYPGPTEATTPTSAPPPAPEFGDTLVPRVGVEHRWALPSDADLSVRGGYFFEPTPAPRAVPARQLFDNDRHAITLGLGAGITGLGSRFGLDAWAQVHVLPTRAGLDAAGNPTSHGGSLWHLGVSASVTF
jgi:long-chain fatty acid transport protein